MATLSSTEVVYNPAFLAAQGEAIVEFRADTANPRAVPLKDPIARNWRSGSLYLSFGTNPYARELRLRRPWLKQARTGSHRMTLRPSSLAMVLRWWLRC
jgi:hypothetical protein